MKNSVAVHLILIICLDFVFSRLGQFVSVSKAPLKKIKADRALRSTVCVAARYMGMVS